MICSTVLSNLGYECHSIADDLILINTPSLLKMVALFRHTLNKWEKIVLLSLTMLKLWWEMNARGINLTTNRIDQIKSTLKRYGLNLNDRAEINTTTSGECYT
ncbi:hypothetical protein [Avibacterium paragallinarum]|uniref:Uncharacterized protein n=1 Tax=Avibacterium paragallinarum TaxID=728 RepID=A0A380Z1C8_AVIPA|nr:hypothetical protein [Avibacterium paragallinarum]SUV40787.1 Uncharacterised protein [Avibacterium paragallinarum]